MWFFVFRIQSSGFPVSQKCYFSPKLLLCSFNSWFSYSVSISSNPFIAKIALTEQWKQISLRQSKFVDHLLCVSKFLENAGDLQQSE